MLTKVQHSGAAPTLHLQFRARPSASRSHAANTYAGRRHSRAALVATCGLPDLMAFVTQRDKGDGFASDTASKVGFGGLGASISEGGREEQEDAYWVYPSKLGYIFAGVYDGHMGQACSKFLRDNMHTSLERLVTKDRKILEVCKGDGASASQLSLGPTLTDCFEEVDQALLKHLTTSSVSAEEKTCGTTATVLMVWPKRLVVAHAGDTRAVMAGKNNSCMDLTADHRPFGSGTAVKREIARVKESGAWVSDGRVMGLLAVSRALGDPDFKDGREKLLQDGVRDQWWTQDFANKIKLKSAPVVSKPDLSDIELTQDHEFVIVATDGLWDVCSSSQAVNLVRQEFKSGKSVQEAADALKDHAVKKRKTADNVTVVIVRLR